MKQDTYIPETWTWKKAPDKWKIKNFLQISQKIKLPSQKFLIEPRMKCSLYTCQIMN